MEWIISNSGTIVAAVILMLSLVLAFKSIITKKKKKKGTCSGNCIDCHYGDNCH